MGTLNLRISWFNLSIATEGDDWLKFTFFSRIVVQKPSNIGKYSYCAFEKIIYLLAARVKYLTPETLVVEIAAPIRDTELN